ncbi:hypothetical protein [Streptomyces sp. NPDC001948]
MPGPGGIPDLDENRVLVEWLEWQLRQARNRVRELEDQEPRRTSGQGMDISKIKPVVDRVMSVAKM